MTERYYPADEWGGFPTPEEDHKEVTRCAKDLVAFFEREGHLYPQWLHDVAHRDD